MEIVFLLVGLIFIAVGTVITLSEVRARLGTHSVSARVIGFSTGRSNKPNSPSFHSVAQYLGPDGRTYYVEGAVGSSAPLHAVGDSVIVLVSPTQPEKAVLKSALSFVLGIIIALMGLASAMAFWFTFHASAYSLGMAAVVVIALAFKIKKAWRKEPLSLAAWQEYKKQIFSPRVFTDQSKDQISWADPISVTVAIQSYEKSNRFAVPLLFVLGFGLVFLGQHFYKKTDAFLEKANRTEGLVVDFNESDSSDSTTYAAVVEYRDRQGQNHKLVDSFSSSPPSYNTGQIVSVLYNRENPGEAQIDRGRANYWLTFLLGFAGVLFILLGAFSARKRFGRHVHSSMS